MFRINKRIILIQNDKETKYTNPMLQRDRIND